MASKIYTAQEMRNVAECLHYDNPTRFITEAAAMLRQAADAAERDEREKKYEYAAKYDDGFISELHSNTAYGTEYARGNTGFSSVVRREVGDWEEVQ